MALTLEKNSLEIDLGNRLARGRFFFDSRSDLPDRGAAAAWASIESEAMGGSFYVDNVVVQGHVIKVAEIVARQPGFTWTWCDGSGNPLTPIARRGTYQIWPGTSVEDGDLQYNYANLFSDWDPSDNWSPGEADPLTGQLKTWEIEFVSTTQYSAWVHQTNGTWPTGLTPPTAGAGKYWCRSMRIEEEIWTNADESSPTTYYRHFAVFWEAPAIGGSTLTFIYPNWS